MKEKHLFVCYSTLSLDAARRIAANELAAEETYLLALFAVPDSSLVEFSRAFVMLPPPHSLSEWVKPFAIARWFRKVMSLLALGKEERLVIYAAHPFELPANHLIYSEPRVTRRELLPDGLLNYTHNQFLPTDGMPRIRYLVRVQLRRIAARMNGFHYERLRVGHLTQFEHVPYERCWTDNPEGFLTRRGEVASLPRRAVCEPVGAEQRTLILFLDQELAPLVRMAREESLRRALLSYLRTLEGEIAYKAHPRGKNRSAELVALGLPVSDFTETESAESIIARHQVTHLVGFYSTPLLLSGDQVGHRECILPHPGASGVKNPFQVQEYVDAMTASGAHVTLCR